MNTKKLKNILNAIVDEYDLINDGYTFSIHTKNPLSKNQLYQIKSKTNKRWVCFEEEPHYLFVEGEYE